MRYSVTVTALRHYYQESSSPEDAEATSVDQFEEEMAEGTVETRTQVTLIDKNEED